MLIMLSFSFALEISAQRSVQAPSIAGTGKRGAPRTKMLPRTTEAATGVNENV